MSQSLKGRMSHDKMKGAGDYDNGGGGDDGGVVVVMVTVRVVVRVW